MLFLVVTTMIWLGSIDGSREIIKERPLMERERAVGVKVSAYLSSKAIVLFGLVALQALMLVVVTFGLRPLRFPQEYVKVFAICCMTGFISVGMGLLISSLVSSEDPAASFIPLALIRSFSSVARSWPSRTWARSSPPSPTSSTRAGPSPTSAQRSTCGSGSRRCRRDARAGVRYDPDFFDLTILPALGVLVVFLVAVLGVTYFALRSYRRQG